MADEKTHTKADIDAAVAAAVAKVQESIDRLETKNEGLLDDLKKAQREARAAKDIKPEDLHSAEERADKAEAALAEAQKSVKSLTGERDKAAESLKTEQGFTHKLVVENGLREQLTANGITHPPHQKGAIAMLSGQVQIVTDGDNRVAKVGDKLLADFVKEWAGGDEGKSYVLAPNNHGGQAPGGTKAKADAKTMTRSAYDALDQQAKGEAGLQMAKGDLKLIDQTA